MRNWKLKLDQSGGSMTNGGLSFQYQMQCLYFEKNSVSLVLLQSD